MFLRNSKSYQNYLNKKTSILIYCQYSEWDLIIGIIWWTIRLNIVLGAVQEVLVNISEFANTKNSSALFLVLKSSEMNQMRDSWIWFIYVLRRIIPKRIKCHTDYLIRTSNSQGTKLQSHSRDLLDLNRCIP